MSFYEITAQVIPVFVIAFVLQTRLQAVKLTTHIMMSTELMANPSNDEPWKFVAKIFKGSVSLVFVSELVSLSVVFVGGAPWPVSLLVWPGLIAALLLLFVEISWLVNEGVEEAAIRWMEAEIEDAKAGDSPSVDGQIDDK